MSIKPYLDDLDVNPETKRVLGVALEKARVSLGLADDFANGIIAKRIVEIAETGERDPELLCEGAVEKLAALAGATGHSGGAHHPLRLPRG
jgi:hypothetical protein